MIQIISYWYKRYLTHPQAGLLLISLILFFGVILTLNKILAPVFISIVIAYMLDWAISALRRWKVPRKLAVIIVFLLFLAVVIAFLLVLLPLIIKQLSNFLTDLPDFAGRMQANLQTWLHDLPYISDDQISAFVSDVKTGLNHSTRGILTGALAVIPNMVTIIVYFVMVPLLLYFFLMDKTQIQNWCRRFLPAQHQVLSTVGREMQLQINNYVRCKFLEAVIVAVVSWIAFALLGLDYAILLALLVGVSVFVPYIGAIVATIPVVVVGAIQWGLSAHFIYLMIIYGIIIAFDGTVLVAVLFSEAVAIHPIVVIIATLFFGSLWGFWGVFFAIPLASLCKAVMNAWPVNDMNYSKLD